MKKKIMAIAAATMLATSMFGVTASAATYVDYDTYGVYRDWGASDYKTTDYMYLKGYTGDYTLSLTRISAGASTTRCIVNIRDSGRTAATFTRVSSTKYGGDGKETTFTVLLDADGTQANASGEGYIKK